MHGSAIPSTRPLIQVLEEHSRPVLSLAVSGTRLFSGSYDYTIRVWDLETMAKEATLRGHTDAVRTLAVAGGKLFSGSYDGTVKVGRSEAVVLYFFTGVYRSRWAVARRLCYISSLGCTG